MWVKQCCRSCFKVYTHKEGGGRVFYVDDRLTGADSVDKAVKLHNRHYSVRADFYFVSGILVRQQCCSISNQNSVTFSRSTQCPILRNTRRPWGLNGTYGLIIFVSPFLIYPLLITYQIVHMRLTLPRHLMSWGGSLLPSSWRKNSYKDCGKRRWIGMILYRQLFTRHGQSGELSSILFLSKIFWDATSPKMSRSHPCNSMDSLMRRNKPMLGSCTFIWLILLVSSTLFLSCPRLRLFPLNDSPYHVWSYVEHISFWNTPPPQGSILSIAERCGQTARSYWTGSWVIHVDSKCTSIIASPPSWNSFHPLVDGRNFSFPSELLNFALWWDGQKLLWLNSNEWPKHSQHCFQTTTHKKLVRYVYSQLLSPARQSCRLIVFAVSLDYSETAGNDISIFNAHSIKGAFTSKAAIVGITIHNILKAADWKSKSKSFTICTLRLPHMAVWCSEAISKLQTALLKWDWAF